MQTKIAKVLFLVGFLFSLPYFAFLFQAIFVDNFQNLTPLSLMTYCANLLGDASQCPRWDMIKFFLLIHRLLVFAILLYVAGSLLLVFKRDGLFARIASFWKKQQKMTRIAVILLTTIIILLKLAYISIWADTGVPFPKKCADVKYEIMPTYEYIPVPGMGIYSPPPIVMTKKVCIFDQSPLAHLWNEFVSGVRVLGNWWDNIAGTTHDVTWIVSEQKRH